MAGDYYKILGVEKGATKEEIKRAYRRLAHQFHPDKVGAFDSAKRAEAEKRFKEINEAYQVLSDDDKRSQYDRFGRVFEGAQGGPAGGFGGWPDFGGFRWAEGDVSGIEFDLGEVFGDLFGGGQAARTRPKGRDSTAEIQLTLEEVFHGLTKRLELRHYIICEHCQGSGGDPFSGTKQCPTCQGEGRIRRKARTFLGSFEEVKTCSDCDGEGKVFVKVCPTCHGEGRIFGTNAMDVVIPAGVENGAIIKRIGEGEPPERKSSRPGDFYLKIKIKAHPVFRREAEKLFITLPISFTEAALGAAKTIPTIEGKPIEVKIPAGVQSGELLRVKAEGMKEFQGSRRGDLFVEVKVETPKKVSRRARELLEELDDEFK